MPRKNRARVYRFQVEACPREYKSDAGLAGSLVIDAAGENNLEELADLIGEETQSDEPFETFGLEHESVAVSEVRTVESLGLAVGNKIRLWGWTSLQLTVKSITGKSAGAVALPKVVENRFDGDWLAELERRGIEEFRREHPPTVGDDGEEEDGHEATESSESAPVRMEWHGGLLNLKTGEQVVVRHASREERRPGPSYAHSIIRVLAKEKLPKSVGRMELLNADGTAALTLECRDWKKWKGASFDSLGVQPVRVDQGEIDSFEAFVMRYCVEPSDRCTWFGSVKVMVYNFAEFWKQKARGLRK